MEALRCSFCLAAMHGGGRGGGGVGRDAALLGFSCDKCAANFLEITLQTRRLWGGVLAALQANSMGDKRR